MGSEQQPNPPDPHVQAVPATHSNDWGPEVREAWPMERQKPNPTTLHGIQLQTVPGTQPNRESGIHAQWSRPSEPNPTAPPKLSQVQAASATQPIDQGPEIRSTWPRHTELQHNPTGPPSQVQGVPATQLNEETGLNTRWQDPISTPVSELQTVPAAQPADAWVGFPRPTELQHNLLDPQVQPATQLDDGETGVPDQQKIGKMSTSSTTTTTTTTATSTTSGPWGLTPISVS